MKKFDIAFFNKNKNSLNEYIYEPDTRTVVHQQELIDSYWEFHRKEDNYFEEVYEFYKDGGIKSSFLSFPNDFVKGIWKEYNEQGILIKEENVDAPFTYSWENIKVYLKAQKVNDIKKQVNNISRWHDDESTTWTLDFNGTYRDIKGRFVITLDGKTGEELEVKRFRGKKALGETGTIADYEMLYQKED